MGTVALARTEAATGFSRTIDNAAGFQCVVATADPASLTLAKGASGGFTVTERGLDDQRALPSSSNVRVYSGDLELNPVGNKIHAPASGLAFRATSRGGASVAEVPRRLTPRVRPDAEDPDQRAQIRVPGPLHRQLETGVQPTPRDAPAWWRPSTARRRSCATR